MYNRANVGVLENSVPSWISDHLGERSYMADEVNKLPSSHRKDPPSPKLRPSADALPPIERETNTMSQGELDCLRESFYFPSSIQIRLLEA